MSLINDALKKAQTAQPENPAPAPGPALQLANVSHRDRVHTLAFFGVVALFLAGVMLAVWYFSARPDLVVRAKSLPAVSTPAPAPAVTPEPVTALATPVVSSAVDSTNEAPAVDPAPATSEPAAVAQPQPQLPAFKLDALFFRPKNPAAVINGETVSVGSVVGGARVVAIDSRSATLITAAGLTNVLAVAN